MIVNDHIERLEGHLRSLAAFRSRALAEGNERQAARAEQAIVNMEAQVAALIADLERQGETSEDAKGADEGARAGRQHILAINGEPDFLNLIRSLLQDERFNVTTTNFVPESFAMIDALQPALLIVDLVIGERAGWELRGRLHREAGTRGIPVIAVSGDSVGTGARALGRAAIRGAARAAQAAGPPRPARRHRRADRQGVASPPRHAAYLCTACSPARLSQNAARHARCETSMTRRISERDRLGKPAILNSVRGCIK